MKKITSFTMITMVFFMLSNFVFAAEPGKNVGNAELNVSFSLNQQPNLIVGEYNVVGKYVLSAINRDVIARNISVKMEGDIANIRSSFLKVGTSILRATFPALDKNGTAVFIPNWKVPKNTSQELEIQFMVTDQYRGGLTVIIEKVNARDTTGRSVEVKGLPCRGITLLQAKPAVIDIPLSFPPWSYLEIRTTSGVKMNALEAFFGGVEYRRELEVGKQHVFSDMNPTSERIDFTVEVEVLGSGGNLQVLLNGVIIFTCRITPDEGVRELIGFKYSITPPLPTR